MSRKSILAYKLINPTNTEATIYCYSEDRMKKEQAIVDHFVKKLEDGLKGIQKSIRKSKLGLSSAYVIERVGRLQGKCRGFGQHYEIKYTTAKDNGSNGTDDAANIIITDMTWTKVNVENTMAASPGVYSLRTNLVSVGPEAIWDIYTTLTELESAFRCFKSELSLRTVYHYKESRVDIHIFIRILAYQVVSQMRELLMMHRIDDSWETIRTELESHIRATLCYTLLSGEKLKERINPDPPNLYVKSFYDKLGIDPGTGVTLG
jgi:transposase